MVCKVHNIYLCGVLLVLQLKLWVGSIHSWILLYAALQGNDGVFKSQIFVIVDDTGRKVVQVAELFFALSFKHLLDTGTQCCKFKIHSLDSSYLYS